MVPMEKCDRETFLRNIKERVFDTTHISTDGWAGYRSWSTQNYIHGTTNHKESFRDAETGSCTNLIENMWRCLKTTLPPIIISRYKMQSYLTQFLWCKNMEKVGGPFWILFYWWISWKVDGTVLRSVRDGKLLINFLLCAIFAVWKK